MVNNAAKESIYTTEEFEAKMKGKRNLEVVIRKQLLKSLRSYQDLKIVSYKPVLDLKFQDHFVKEHKINALGNSTDENQYYRFFMNLKKHGLVHPRSVRYRKKRTMVSINPNMPSLHRVNLSHVDTYKHAKHKLLTMQTDDTMEQLYTYLRFFNLQLLYPNELKRIKHRDVCFVKDNLAFIYLERSNVLSSQINPYQLVEVHSHKIVKILKTHCLDNDMFLFPKIDELESRCMDFKKDTFGSLSISAIHMSGINLELFSMSSMEVAITSSRSVAPSITLAELNVQYPECISKRLMETENKRVLHALQRPDKDDETLESEAELFSIEQFMKLDELLRIKKTSEFRTKVNATINELQKYIDNKESSEHLRLIAVYIMYLLKRYKNKEKMAASTFKNYIGLLNKHLFTKVEDLSNVQSHELDVILSDLARLQYKHKSIRKVRALIRTFFKISNTEHKLKTVNLSSYPKSLIFKSEIDQVLHYLHDSVVGSAERMGARNRFIVLQLQALLLLGFYTGLRKSELRSRLLSDVYIYDDFLCVDVNKKGMKKLDMTLKTSNAKRRVCTKVENAIHLSIIKDFLDRRKSLSNKSPFVFLRVSDDNTIRSKAIDESIFDDITSVLQSLTGRYVTFHSLRHSFATYEVKRILENTSSDPYAMMDLAVKMGHESPETTLKVYTHHSVLDLGGIPCT